MKRPRRLAGAVLLEQMIAVGMFTSALTIALQSYVVFYKLGGRTAKRLEQLDQASELLHRVRFDAVASSRVSANGATLSMVTARGNVAYSFVSGRKVVKRVAGSHDEVVAEGVRSVQFEPMGSLVRVRLAVEGGEVATAVASGGAR